MAVVAVTVGVVLAGCADAAVGSPGAKQSVLDNVGFYPACGNETLTLEGVTWYSMPTEDSADFATPLALGAAALPGLGTSRGLPVVAAPGPGDDIGTLVIYEGGYAYFRSDNGELTRWLTTEPIEYNFVC